jgi:hypothetical protein
MHGLNRVRNWAAAIANDPIAKAEMVEKRRASALARSRKNKKRKYKLDDDIRRYRAEKEARTEYGPATHAMQVCFEVAAQLKAEKPKAGRPKGRGFMPQTFGKYAA